MIDNLEASCLCCKVLRGTDARLGRHVILDEGGRPFQFVSRNIAPPPRNQSHFARSCENEQGRRHDHDRHSPEIFLETVTPFQDAFKPICRPQGERQKQVNEIVVPQGAAEQGEEQQELEEHGKRCRHDLLSIQKRAQQQPPEAGDQNNVQPRYDDGEQVPDPRTRTAFYEMQEDQLQYGGFPIGGKPVEPQQPPRQHDTGQAAHHVLGIAIQAVDQQQRGHIKYRRQLDRNGDTGHGTGNPCVRR